MADGPANLDRTVPSATAAPVPPEVWASPEYVQRQIDRIEDALTQVLFGDYSAVVRTEGGDPVWGNLAMHVNVVINAVRNAIARAEKSEALAAMRLELEDRNRRLQEALAALEQQNRQMSEADRLRRQMFANVSHEFRTPLTLCLTPLSQLLSGEEEPLSPRQEYLVGIAQSSASRLLSMISGLLDLARLDADAIEVRRERADLGALLERLVELFRPTAQDRGVRLSLRLPPGRLTGVVDASLFEKVVANLLSNAFKFTPAGGRVLISAGASPRGLHLAVRDWGIGIGADALPTIFDRFRQVDGSLARRYEGSGIGLALVKEFAERMDGTVTVRSWPGAGTVFRVFLPHHEADAAVVPRAPATFAQRRLELGLTTTRRRGTPVLPAAPSAPSADRTRPRVLVVEDNDEMAALLCSLLGREFEPRRVTNGRRALEALEHFDPDAILSDLMMPEMDGLTLCRALKARPELAPIPVILLTAQSDRESVVAGWEAGADDYLTKPFQAHELRVRVRSLVRLRASHRALAARTAELEEAHRQILRSQAQLVQSSKLAAVGQLAAGIAHEINNPLTTILGFAQSLARRAGGDPAHALAIESIVREARRSRDLVQDLLGFSRSSTGQQTRQEPAALLRRTRSLCEHRARLQGVQLEVASGDGLPGVRGDPQRLEQVLVNLVNNALDATPAGGRIEVAAVADDRVVRLSVRDGGPGVPDAIRDRIFEPFFTTKPAGKGTGLGLALCAEIVQAHGGTIAVADVAGPDGSTAGACFVVELPIHREEGTCRTASLAAAAS